MVKFQKSGTFKKLGGYEGTITRGKQGHFQVVIQKSFNVEASPHLVDAFMACPSQARLSLKSDWEFMRDFFNDSYSGHSFEITKRVPVEGGAKDEKRDDIVSCSAWAFAEHQLLKCYPSFYSMDWGCKGMLCARFLAALNFENLLCCRFFQCECNGERMKEAGIWMGWICCLCNNHICAIIHADRWGKADILIKDMPRFDTK